MLIFTFPRRWLCSRVTVNIGASRHVADRVAMPRTQVIYHGVPPSTAATETGESSASAGVCSAYVGRMVNQKGVPVLLRAARLLATRGYEFRLKLIGEGLVRPEPERMTDELGLRGRTIFTGFLEGRALQEALREATAAVMPSIWEDVASSRLQRAHDEWKASNRFRPGWPGRTLRRSGSEVSAGDAEALAECLRRVVDDPDLARELGSKARARAKELFVQDRMVSDHVQVYFGSLQIRV